MILHELLIKKSSNKFCNLEQSPMSSNEFLKFEDMEIYGFTLKQYPVIDGLVATIQKNVSSFLFTFFKLISSLELFSNELCDS